MCCSRPSCRGFREREALAEFSRQYALERQWLEIKSEARPFDLQQYQWWDWYYFDAFNWLSIRE
jgi:hypothetical protein